MKLLLITPPFTQLNTLYPATAFLKGFLNTQGITSNQVDLSLEVILELFSQTGLLKLFREAEKSSIKPSLSSKRMIDLQDNYIYTINPVISFLQGDHPTLAHLICRSDFLPEGPRFSQTGNLEWSFGSMGIRDQARHLATLYLEDIIDFIVEMLDPHFGFSRYAERLGRSAYFFIELDDALMAPPSFIDQILFELLEKKISSSNPNMVVITVPFPGNLYSALRCGQWLKIHNPNIKVVMGGGFVNTELRSLTNTKVFDYVDFITLDDGELPLLHLIEYLKGNREKSLLTRTFLIEDLKVTYIEGIYSQEQNEVSISTPDLTGLRLNEYLSVIEVVNSMHRLWSDGRWNKLNLAHGCYWARCSFCDTSLDYINRYKPFSAEITCNRIEEMIAQTGEYGFHFVDEAAPPTLLRDLALEIIRRKLTVSWWTNIRFEKNFTPDLCYLLREAGCIAVSGGLEVASPRIMDLINKGVTVEQVARVADQFTEAGIMVHAYLMYGFPTQTAQETIDSLEVVRQMFELEVIQSGFWHQFALTAHSQVGKNPEKFGIKIHLQDHDFAWNDLEYDDLKGCDHGALSDGLKKSLYNFLHGIGLELPLQHWFDFKIPNTQLHPDYIYSILQSTIYSLPKPTSQIIWLGNQPAISFFTKNKKEKTYKNATLKFKKKNGEISIEMPESQGKWLFQYLSELSIFNNKPVTFESFKNNFLENNSDDFDNFMLSRPMKDFRKNGLIIL